VKSLHCHIAHFCLQHLFDSYNQTPAFYKKWNKRINRISKHGKIIRLNIHVDRDKVIFRSFSKTLHVWCDSSIRRKVKVLTEVSGGHYLWPGM
jgi:hypothetical protein